MKRFYMIVYDGKYIVKDKENEVPSVRCKNEGECREVIEYLNDTLMYKNYYSDEESRLRKKTSELSTENFKLHMCINVLIDMLHEKPDNLNYSKINQEIIQECVDKYYKED